MRVTAAQLEEENKVLKKELSAVSRNQKCDELQSVCYALEQENA